MIMMLAAGGAAGGGAGAYAETHGHAAVATATPAAAHAKTGALAKADTHATAEAHHPAGTAPDQAMTFLRNGNKRFLSGKLRKDGQAKKDIARLATGQKPHTIVLSCSDSRVPPEIIFDQKLGEIFVIRTAGEVLDPMAIASIEYALEHLGSNLILVMGHTQCGAVKAALATIGGQDAGSPHPNKPVAPIPPPLPEFS